MSQVQRCENDGGPIERCTCGGTACPGWGHVRREFEATDPVRHYCPPDWERKPHPAPQRQPVPSDTGDQQ